MKLKGIQLKGTYKVEFEDTHFEVYDERDNMIYYEDSDGFWIKREYDEKDNIIYFEGSDGCWSKSEYNSKNKIVYYENSDGYWFQKEYDEKGNEIYFEDSLGDVIDNRIKELTINEIEKLLGYKIKIKGE